MARPSKAQVKARKQVERQQRRAERRTIGDLSQVVCERCRFAQPYVVGAKCLRGAALGPDLECPGETCVTVEAYADAA